MESIWFKPELADEIIKNNNILQQTKNVVTDIVSGRIDITHLVENMAGVLTNKEAENREKGIRFFTNLLKDLPKDYLTEMQVKFIAQFYTDRLKDNHRVIPAVLEGYLFIIEMENYNMNNTLAFLTILFREVSCQSQVRQDRLNIYLIIKKLMDRDMEYMKALGPDLVYGMISSMDGERDPRNLLHLFEFLPYFLKNIPIGHLNEEMFDVMSCYYPIDFHPSPDDPTAVSRQELATALCPCLCAIPEFAEQCLILLVEKLDSSLRIAKLDSLKLVAESCKTFKPESYGPFLKTLWSSIHREITHKTDEELKMSAHEALSALIANLATAANTDQGFEGFVKGILIVMQTAIAESTTVAQFVEATKILLTAANASKESCVIIIRSMIPATVAYYGFRTSTKLQTASLDFLADMYELAKHWDVLLELDKQINEIPVLCLTAVSQPIKDYQIAGFKTLIKVINALPSELVLPFVEVLIHNVQNSQDSDVLAISVETVHAIARKYPELIMNIVVKGKCDLEHLTEDKTALVKRLNLLSNLASIDEFTKVIIEEMLKLIKNNDKDASKVVEALSESMANSTLFSDQKVTEIESDHGLIGSVLAWLLKEINESPESLSHGYILIANTISSLPSEKQLKILSKHSPDIIKMCKIDEIYFHVLESIYSSLHQSIYDQQFEEIMILSLNLSLNSENVQIRTKACVLIAHFLNKTEFGQKFERMYDILKSHISSKENDAINPRLLTLYGWIAKSLIMRGHDLFMFWLKKYLILKKYVDKQIQNHNYEPDALLEKITNTLSNPDYCKQGSDAIHLIMTEYPDHLNTKRHCRISLLYRQRMFQSFSSLAENIEALHEKCKEAYYLSWAYVLERVPKSVLSNEAAKVAPILIDALVYDNKDLLLVMTDVLSYFVQAKHVFIADSLQTILPRLVKLSGYVKSMDVRIKSLQCLYDIANTYRTSLLLPHKQDILLDLAPSLDDKKRLVRNMAVRARTRWYLIGAPGEAKEN